MKYRADGQTLWSQQTQALQIFVTTSCYLVSPPPAFITRNRKCHLGSEFSWTPSNKVSFFGSRLLLKHSFLTLSIVKERLETAREAFGRSSSSKTCFYVNGIQEKKSLCIKSCYCNTFETCIFKKLIAGDRTFSFAATPAWSLCSSDLYTYFAFRCLKI